VFCLLDTASGASISVRQMLVQRVAAGRDWRFAARRAALSPNGVVTAHTDDLRAP
jgi:hypothetical protein